MFVGRWSLFGVSCSLIAFRRVLFVAPSLFAFAFVVGLLVVIGCFFYFDVCRLLFACCCVVCVVCRLFVGAGCLFWLLLVVWRV